MTATSFSVDSTTPGWVNLVQSKNASNIVRTSFLTLCDYNNNDNSNILKNLQCGYWYQLAFLLPCGVLHAKRPLRSNSLVCAKDQTCGKSLKHARFCSKILEWRAKFSSINKTVIGNISILPLNSLWSSLECRLDLKKLLNILLKLLI